MCIRDRADVDLDVLRQLIEASVAAMAPQRIFPSNKDITQLSLIHI